MKKLLKKRVLIPLAIVVALAIAAVSAYAAFSGSVATGNSAVATSAVPAITLNSQGSGAIALTFANIVPASGPSSPTAVSQTVLVTGDPTMGLNVAMTTSSPGWYGDSSVANDIQVQISGDPNGVQTTTLWGLLNGSVPLGTWSPTGSANVTITMWLPANAGNGDAGQGASDVVFTFTGTQIVQ
jgi:hypothetical protein